MNLNTTTRGNRTLLFEEDLHVATIVEQQRPKGRESGLYMWYVAFNGGRASSRAEAEQAIREELTR